MREFGQERGRDVNDAIQEAEQRRDRMERCLPACAPDDLLLATSPNLLRELNDCAQKLQPRAPWLVPHKVVQQTVAHVWKPRIEALGASPFYLGAERKSDREYLIYTAVMTEADCLITDDMMLHQPGSAPHHDERTRRRVSTYRLDDFIDMALPSQFRLDYMDAQAVMRAAIGPLARAGD